MEIVLAVVFLIVPIFTATYTYGGKGTIKAGAIGLAIVATIVVLMFIAAMLGFFERGFGYEIIIAAYAGMMIVAAMPVSYLVLWVFRKLPRQRE